MSPGFQCLVIVVLVNYKNLGDYVRKITITKKSVDMKGFPKNPAAPSLWIKHFQSKYKCVINSYHYRTKC